MKNNNKRNNIILIVILFVVASLVVYVPKYFDKHKNFLEDDKDLFKVKDFYKSNEYIPIMINDQQMSRIYYKDFVNSVLSDVNSTYNLIDEDYRKKRFGDIYKYKDYINSLNLSISSDVKRYATYERPGYKYYDIYDKEGNRIIFKTKGVLQYKVLFDDIDKGED